MFFHHLFNRKKIAREHLDHLQGMKRYAFTLLKNENAAQEIVQIVCEQPMKSGTENDLQPDMKLHLYQSVYYHAIKRKSEETFAGSSATQAVSASSREEKQLSAELSRCVLGLPIHYQDMLYKSRLEKKNFSEIAFEMNLSVRNIEKQMSRAFRLLRDQWQQERQKNRRLWLTK